ncbi:DegT/DnrJ/EryC1/StrS family aminotransferase [Amylibacter sp.]|jgi:UDP-2-acetamido-2-deoxy-ribo-hexuluronate aminotransferase|nr:DegT/DnrJ/EryC1/StrS family aminotransferase [Amylibacter sp.]
MKVKYTDLSKRFSGNKNLYVKAFEEILQSGQYIGGNELNSFEEKVANYLGVKGVVGVGSGTDALYLMLKYHEFSKGSEIITVPNSYLASVSTIFLNNLTPVYANINPKSFQIDTDSVEALITEKTVAIMAVHLMGSPCDIFRLRDIAEKYNLKLFEDFSQSFGAKVNDNYAGAIGDASAASLHPLKNLPCFGDGGLLCSDNEQLINWIRLARSHGHPHRDECEFWSFNMRLDNLQASIASLNLNYLDNVIVQRQKLASIYQSKLKNIFGLELLEFDKKLKHTYHTFVIKVDNRTALKNYLFEHGIETNIHYPKLIPELNAHPHIMISEDSYFINSKVLSLPISEEHTEEEIIFVCEKIIKYYERYN